MSHPVTRIVLILSLFIGLLLTGIGTRADEAAKPKAAASSEPPVIQGATLNPPTQDWRSDPACQLVFFAVLEGLYTDGVPDEVVDLIVPPATKEDEHAGVKRCFVFRCPLCHAAYEAFVLYQQRQGFHGSGEKKSTLGKNFDRTILEQLKSDKAQTRVFAMGRLIRPWIERRMNLQNLSGAEQKALLDKLLAYAAEGDKIFQQYRGKWSVYMEWQFYGGCQACEAAKTVAEQMERSKTEKPLK